MFFADAERYEDAFRDFDRSVELLPGEWPAHWQRGLMWEMLASEEDHEALRAALADYERAYELGADEEHVLTARAAPRAKLGAPPG